MSAQEDIEEEYLTCYICYDVFKEPKTLACLHRFCELCLQGYLVGLAETAKKSAFPCPVCREPNPAPDPRRPPADWASLLRTDFHLKNLIKALKAGAHKQGQGGGGAGDGRGSHPCSVHNEKELDLFCADCSCSICHLCAGISHRGCSQVITLAEAAADHRATLDLRYRRQSQRLTRLSELRGHMDRAIEGLGGQYSQAEAAIHKRAEMAIAAVRRQETEQVEELHRLFQSLHRDVTKRLVAMDNEMRDCKQVLETEKNELKASSDADVVENLSSLLVKDELTMDEDKLRSVLSRLKDIRLEFRPATSMNVKLGDISLSLTPLDRPTTDSSMQASSKNGSPSPSQKPPLPERRLRSQTLAAVQTTSHVSRDPVKLRTIPGKFREDEHSPKLRDVLVLSALKVVLVTDWANQCVKAFHERRDRDSRLGVGGKPWCLARVSDTAVAVSLPVSSQICVLKVTPRLALLSSFFAQKRYSGLAALTSDTLVASGGSDPPSVDVINLGGEVLRSFSLHPTTGGELFAYPGYIAMVPGHPRRFLVSDRRRAALLCMDTSGQVIFTFRPQGSRGLQEPGGVRADGRGGVYLAEARGVVRLTAGGRFERAVLRAQDGVRDPRGLDLDLDAGGLLYVTSHEGDLLVYKLP